MAWAGKKRQDKASGLLTLLVSFYWSVVNFSAMSFTVIMVPCKGKISPPTITIKPISDLVGMWFPKRGATGSLRLPHLSVLAKINIC